MADESSVAAGKRFSRDMRLIREDRDTSIDTLHKETRISRSLIESFEQGGLYDHPTFNEVYLRSFVRAYAEAIDISPDAALDGLADALEGTYEDALADQYLSSTPTQDDTSRTESVDADGSAAEEEGEDSDRPSSATPSAGGPEGRGGIVGPPRALGEEPESESLQSETPESEEPEDAPRDAGSEPGPEEESDGDTAPDVGEGPEEREPPSRPESTTEGTVESSASLSPSEEPSEAGPSASSAGSDPRSETEAAESEEGSSDERDEEASSGGTPSWMDEQSSEEEETAPPSTEGTGSPASAVSGAEGEPPPAGGPGDTGIVGEPTALGGEEAPAEPARPDPSAAPEPGSQRRSGWLQFVRGEKQEMVWAGIGIVVILVVLVGLGLAFFSSTSPAQQEAQTASAPDTSAAPASSEDTTAVPQRPPLANVTIGDTIYLTVLADAPVSGIRIQRDEDLQRPYWIEEGEAEVYPFQQRITLENELGDVRLFLAGYPYQLGPQDTTGQIEITRSQVEAFADTLRGSPAALSVTPDTIPKGPPAQQEPAQQESAQ